MAPRRVSRDRSGVLSHPALLRARGEPRHRARGAVDQVYEPAYVEDLDVGYRAWQRGWPSVYAAGAIVEHRHRATTSRFYTEEQLGRILEINYLRFLGRAVSDRALFRRLW